MGVSELIEQDLQSFCCSNLDKFSFFSKKTIVVTGASGLIGTYALALFKKLWEKGIRFKLFPIVRSNEPIIDLSLLDAQIIKLDLSNFDDYSKLPNADLVIHTAGYGQPMRFMADAASTLAINTSATNALLQKLNTGGTFIFASSVELYTDGPNPPFSENDIGQTNPYHPRSPYIEGKRCGEAICNAFAAQGVRAISIRFGDIYGPGARSDDKRAVNNFIDKAIKHKRIEMLDSGSAVRTYLYVADAVETIIRIILTGKENLYNVADTAPVKIAEVAQKVADELNVPLILPDKAQGIAGAPENLVVDISRVENEFGKIKTVSLDEGLKKTIHWRRELLKDR